MIRPCIYIRIRKHSFTCRCKRAIWQKKNEMKNLRNERQNFIKVAYLTKYQKSVLTYFINVISVVVYRWKDDVCVPFGLHCKLHVETLLSYLRENPFVFSRIMNIGLEDVSSWREKEQERRSTNGRMKKDEEDFALITISGTHYLKPRLADLMYTNVS